MVIKGGYYIKARLIQQSKIYHAPPYVREIWDWLLLNANHSNNEICQRGQLIRTYRDIINGLSWYVGWRKETYSKWDCENAMKLLKKAGMITTKKTTRGILIEIVKYSYYQNPKNYESHRRATMKATGEPQTCHTINNNDKNDRMNINNKQYIEYINFWNFVFKRKYKPIEALLPNFNYWVKIYSLDEIKKAIEVAHADKFWADKMKPVILLRRKNPQGEAVDYIGGFINKERKWKKIGGDFNG